MHTSEGMCVPATTFDSLSSPAIHVSLEATVCRQTKVTASLFSN
jgi:hypothetical protein